MKHIAFVSLAVVAQMAAAPAFAVTNENGDVLISQDAVNAGNVTPGDTPGFPVTISVPGTYRLASNLTVTTAANGIEVRANEVTIDMGGRTLAGSGVGRNGITSFNRNMRVEHGTVRGFTNDGIRSIAQFLTVTNMIVTANGRNGVSAFDGDTSEASIVDSKVSGNVGFGIICANHCLVESSVVTRNQSSGIYFTGEGGVATSNTISRNAGQGIYFAGLGGAGNNTVVLNQMGPVFGFYLPMQPNACEPACSQ